MPIKYEYYLFRNYSKAVKEWLQQTCFLSRYPKDENVLVIYSTPARAFAKYIYPILNGQQIKPTISFTLSGIEYAQGENNLGFVKQYNYDSSNNKYQVVKPLLTYRLTYSVVLRTLLISDMDILLYQILTNATLNAKGVKNVQNQWVEIKASDPRNEINLEPGDAQGKIIRFGIDLIVPRAYLPRDYEYTKSIETYDIDLSYAGDTSETPTEENYEDSELTGP